MASLWDISPSDAEYVVIPGPIKNGVQRTLYEAEVARRWPYADMFKLREDKVIHPWSAVGAVFAFGGGVSAETEEGSGLVSIENKGVTASAGQRGVIVATLFSVDRAHARKTIETAVKGRMLKQLSNIFPRPRSIAFPLEPFMFPPNVWPVLASDPMVGKVQGAIMAWGAKNGVKTIFAPCTLASAKATPLPPPRHSIEVESIPMSSLSLVPPPAPRERPRALNTSLTKLFSEGVSFVDAKPPESSASVLSRMLGGGASETKSEDTRVGVEEYEAFVRLLTVDHLVQATRTVEPAFAARLKAMEQGSDEWLEARRGAGDKRALFPVCRGEKKTIESGSVPEAALKLLGPMLPLCTASTQWATCCAPFVDMMKREEFVEMPEWFAENIFQPKQVTKLRSTIRQLLLTKVWGITNFRGSMFTRWGNTNEDAGLAAYEFAVKSGFVVGPSAVDHEFVPILSSRVKPMVETKVPCERDTSAEGVHPIRDGMGFSYDGLYRVGGGDSGVEQHYRLVEVKAPAAMYDRIQPEHYVQMMFMMGGLQEEGIDVRVADYVVWTGHAHTRIYRVRFKPEHYAFIVRGVQKFRRETLLPLLLAKMQGRLENECIDPKAVMEVSSKRRRTEISLDPIESD